MELTELDEETELACKVAVNAFDRCFKHDEILMLPIGADTLKRVAAHCYGVAPNSNLAINFAFFANGYWLGVQDGADVMERKAAAQKEVNKQCQ